MDQSEFIYLDSTDGFEFEQICKRMFERIYGCPVEVTPSTRDEGKDLLIHHPNGLILVECKHQPQSSIGRPIVQKLHSAIIACGGKTGIIVTTGSIGKSARDYAEQIKATGINIELYDRAILADKASRAGLTIVVNGMKMPISSYEVTSKERFGWAMANHLDGLYESYPYRPSQLLQIKRRDVHFIPCYEVTYQINAVFETTIGPIHYEQLPLGRFIVDGRNGMILTDAILEFYSNLPTIPFSIDSGTDQHPKPEPFSIEISRIKEISTAEIIRRHTKVVSYYGSNYVTYSRQCVPNTRQFTITSIRQLYFPWNESVITLGNTQLQFDFLEHPTRGMKVLDNCLIQCGVCKQIIGQRPSICNTCGSPVHPGSQNLNESHSFRCEGCGKIVCRRCAYYIPKFFSKQVFCDSCITRQPADKIRKF